MIPLRDQEALRRRFATDLQSRVRIDFFTEKPSPIIVPGRQQWTLLGETQAMIEELAAQSPKLALAIHDLGDSAAVAAELGVDRLPAIVLRGLTNRPLRFFGLPSGTLFPAFIEALVAVAGSSNAGLKPETLKQLRKLRTDTRLTLLVATHCRYSPAMLFLGAALALASVRVKLEVVQVGQYPALLQQYGLHAVPAAVIADETVVTGSQDEAALVAALLHVAEKKPVEATAGPSTPILTAAATGAQQQQPTAGTTTASGLYIPR